MTQTDNMELMERGAYRPADDVFRPSGTPCEKQDAENNAERFLAYACRCAVGLEALLVALFFAAAIAAAAVGVLAFADENDSGDTSFRYAAVEVSSSEPVDATVFWLLIGASAQMLILVAAAAVLRNFLYHKRNDWLIGKLDREELEQAANS